MNRNILLPFFSIVYVQICFSYRKTVNIFNLTNTTLSLANSSSNVVTETNAAPAPVIDLKKIKPRVDTHWSGAVPLRSTLQRSTSLRTTAKTGSTTTAVGTAAAALPRLTRSRIGTTATLQTAKLTTVTNTRAKSPEKPTTMRRQESNLTRKSLTKLRAAEAAAKLKDRAAADNVASSAIGFKPITHIEPIAHSQKMLLHVSSFNYQRNIRRIFSMFMARSNNNKLIQNS